MVRCCLQVSAAMLVIISVHGKNSKALGPSQAEGSLGNALRLTIQARKGVCLEELNLKPHKLHTHSGTCGALGGGGVYAGGNRLGN